MDRRRKVFMFSGQGSQYYHMGEDLFHNNEIFQRYMKKLDRIALDMIGNSILEHLFDNKKRKIDLFNRTLFSHPAIFMFEYSMAMTFLELGLEPDYVFGSSLGEYAALSIANVVHVEEMLEIVIRQAQLFEGFCMKGSMLAILNDFHSYDEIPLIHSNSELAAINFNSHYVISGTHENLIMIEKYLRSKEITCQMLPVSFAYHSSLINSIEIEFKKYASQIKFERPKVKILSSSYGNEITGDITKDYIWDVVRKPILFQDAVEYLEKKEECIYFDFGPSGTLSNFVKYNLNRHPASETHAIGTPFSNDIDRFEFICNKFIRKQLEWK
ncbi:acyltransferase domain-containing protein [Paenibacillus popilliae]|uniref:Acyltransferase domain-containing protein n=1 Tax=Paenibacillus popilliae TaxID=78057 RepID=A0ABY3AVC2_PAEPP|nr:acyltransferase domain-containing protein [Paenibacillus sp. SDF0028]TQR46691.1 acyltransferase domain-containing protein [Paenibacillus sp. SDF0028]